MSDKKDDQDKSIGIGILNDDKKENNSRIVIDYKRAYTRCEKIIRNILPSSEDIENHCNEAILLSYKFWCEGKIKANFIPLKFVEKVAKHHAIKIKKARKKTKEIPHDNIENIAKQEPTGEDEYTKHELKEVMKLIDELVHSSRPSARRMAKALKENNYDMKVVREMYKMGVIYNKENKKVRFTRDRVIFAEELAKLIRKSGRITGKFPVQSTVRRTKP